MNPIYVELTENEFLNLADVRRIWLKNDAINWVYISEPGEVKEVKYSTLKEAKEIMFKIRLRLLL